MSTAGARERDPHFRKILEGLAGGFSPQVFEECVQDLLRDAFPSLAAVHGGSDAGMDGAIADGEGEPYPLIVTTSERVIHNLTTSLKSYLAGGGARRQAVVATSAGLSPLKRRNLQQRARELGFVLMQVFDRRDIASRLYRDSGWTKTLLGITGEPPALSAIPRTRRPLLEVEPVGRDADLAWLRENSGDRLIVGEPGSGKTFLLLQLVREGKALFLATDEEGRFADAYRDERPEVVLVDDAHLAPERLDRLRQIRQDIKAEFDIIATSWNGAWEEVADALGGLTGERVRILELLTRTEILEILRRIGVQEPEDDPYLAELVDQAANRPGLAVTLGNLWLRGRYREVLTGEAILRSLVPALRRVMEQDPSQLLAAFALGGERGMGLGVVAEFLGSGVGEVWERATQVGASGVLTERAKDDAGEAVLAVEPVTLRAALLHQVFFSPPARAWRPLLRQAPSPDSAIETLVAAAHRDVPVPRNDLRSLLVESGSAVAWREYALLGETEGIWVVEQYPGQAADMARQVLLTAPRRSIRWLLQEAESAENSGAALSSHPLDHLKSWIQGIPTSNDVAETMRRRQDLVETVLEYLRKGGDQSVGRRAAFLALSPHLESARGTVTGDAVIFRRGRLPAWTVPEMLKLWHRVQRAMDGLDRESWSELRDVLDWWIHPDATSGDKKGQERQQFQEMAQRILKDIVPLTEGHPGLASAVRERAGEVDLELDLSVDPAFEALFPPSPRLVSSEDLEPAWKAQQEAARRLARTWARRTPEEVANDLGRYMAEAEEWGCGWPGKVPEFGRALAREAQAPAEWLRVLLERRASPLLVSSFLSRVVEDQPVGWQEYVERSLKNTAYSWAASDLVLRLPEPPDDLLALALEGAEPQLVETACLQGAVATDTLRRLLSDRDPWIALAAAIGEWLAEPRQNVRPEVGKEWRGVVLSAKWRDLQSRPHEEFWLQGILSQDPGLAFDWLSVQLALEERPLPVSQTGLIPAAVRVLDRPGRARFLAELKPECVSTALIRELVGDSRALYRALLCRTDLPREHLAPLAGRPPDSSWARLARLALDAGHEPREVAAVSFDFLGVYSPTVEHYGRWETAFRRLGRSKHSGLREVACHGLRQAEEMVEKARARDRKVQLTGPF